MFGNLVTGSGSVANQETFMATLFICGQGHTWQLPVGDTLGSTDVQVLCPVCGTPGESSRSKVEGEPQAHAATILQPAEPVTAEDDTRPPGPDSAVVTKGRSDASTPGKIAAAGDKSLPDVPGYEIVEELGRGGMGVVLKARQTKLDRLVALKVLHPEISADVAFAERFGREARALARLSHPHIVTVHDFGQVEGLSYIVMEFVAGVNLRQRLHGHRLPLNEVLTIMAQLCDALQYAHEEGIVHRDIKPENILFDKQGRVRIADFGLAKLTARTTADYTLTGAGQVMGTWNYMAPEQLDNPQGVDHRADIFALGVVLYEMLTGDVPRRGFRCRLKKPRYLPTSTRSSSGRSSANPTGGINRFRNFAQPWNRSSHERRLRLQASPPKSISRRLRRKSLIRRGSNRLAR